MSGQKVKILDIILDINSYSSRKSSNHNDGERLLAWQLSRRHTLTPSKGRINHVRLLLKELAVCRVLYQNMFKETWLEEKCLLGKGTKARGIAAALRELWSKSDSGTCRSVPRSWVEARLHLEPVRTDKCHILSAGNFTARHASIYWKA